MAGGPLSGRYGVVNGITGIRNWQINDNGQTSPFVTSGTALGHGRKGGVTSWSGGYSHFGAVPPVLPGVLFGFQGFTAPDNSLLGSVGQKYVGNAMVDSVSINWDWTSGNVIDNQTSFQGHLGLVPSSGAYPYNDASISDPEPVCGTRIDISSDGTTWTTLPYVLQAGLQIQNQVQAYTNSSTGCTTGRVAGPIDWSANLAIQDTVLGSGLLSKYGIYQFRFYTTSSLFWLLKWGIVKEFTNLQVSPETGQIVQYSATIEMAGVSGGLLGTIKAPGAGSSYWGL
jgi:hypothetical protein